MAALSAFLLLSGGAGTARGQAAQTIQSPANGNPILPAYFADPEMFVFDGKFYLYGSTDGYDVGGIETGPFVGWSSTDLVNWTSTTFDYPGSFPLNSTKNWAPSMAKGPDGRFYFYYISSGYNCFVASSATPLGPWQGENGNAPIYPNMFDTSAFQDTDGSTWLLFMGPKVNNLPSIYAGKLAANMTSFASPPTMIYQSSSVFEGPVMFKRNGRYYLCFSSGSLSGTYNTQVVYSTSIAGPYTVNNPQKIVAPTGSLNYSATGGGNVFQVGNRYFMVYHRMSYPSQGGSWRQTLIDELKFAADDINVSAVVESYDGVGAVAPLSVTLPNLAYGAAAASSSQLNANYLPAYATDQNLGSAWKAATNTYPQWLQVDLGAPRVIGSVATAFEHCAESYQYTIQYSTDGVNWLTYANRSANTVHNSPMVDANTVTARYLKLNLTSSSKTNQSPGVWDLKVYPPASAIAAPAGLTATAAQGDTTLSWSAVPGASGYCVQRGLFRGGPYVTVGYGVAGTSFTDKGVVSGKGSYYVVSAIDGAGAVGAISAPVDPAPGLAASLKFDEGSGVTAADSTGHGWPGTLVNGPVWAAGAGARINNALTLDGVDDHVTLPAGVAGSLNDFTICAWVNLSTVGSWSRIFDFGTGATNYMFLTPKSGDTGKLRFAIKSSGGNEQSFDGAAALPAGVWTHVAVTFSGSSAALYVNGVLSGSSNAITARPASLGVTTLNYLGRSQFAADPYLKGQVDELQIYNRALTVNDLAQLLTPPPAPVNLAAGADNGQVTLSWSSVSGAVTGYNVKRAAALAGPYTTIAAGLTGSTYTDAGLANGTTYYYTVSALNGVAEGPNAAPLPATPAAAWSGVGAANNPDSVDLSWTGAAGATSYNVKRSTTPGGPYTTIAAGVTGTSYQDTTALPGTIYYYVISSVTGATESGNSAPATVRPSPSFAKGADVGWLQQMEATGFKFFNTNAADEDCLKILKARGLNTIRLRVWVSPSTDRINGHCSKDEVVAMAVRAKNLGLRVLIDFHYSDTWADPGHQAKPAAWASHSFAQLLTDVYDHTFDVLSTLKANGVTPEWVQVGNEIPGGFLWPEGSTSNWSQLAQLLNKGYDAVKAVDSGIKVVVHLDRGDNNSLFRGFFDNIRNNGAKWDVIGLSYYPGATYAGTIDALGANLNDMAARYGKEVMVVEVGADATQAQYTRDLVVAVQERVKAVPNNRGLGVVYWEPEGQASWSGYSMSCWANGRPTAAIGAFDDDRGFNRASGGAAAAGASAAPNEAALAFDGDPATKWVNPGATGWIQYDLGAGKSAMVTRYDLTSSDGAATGDPKSWQFQASNDGTSWVTLDTRANEVFSARLLTNPYRLANRAAYRYYRLNITGNNGSSAGTQLAELALIAPGADGAPPNVHLKFDESSGTTAADSSGRGWTGTLVNGPAWVTGTNGKINNAVSLDGTNDYVSLPAGVVSAFDDLTVSAWVKPVAVADWARIFDFGTGTANYMSLTARSGDTGKLRFAIKTAAGTEQFVDGAAALPAGVWTHVAVTLSGSSVSLYVNGALSGRSSAITFRPSSLGTTTLNFLGRSQFATDPYFNGTVDDFRISNRALTAGEVAALVPSSLAAPQNVTATGGAKQVALAWNVAANATGYNLKRSGVSGGPYTLVGPGLTTPGITDTGLADGATYYYVVSSLAAGSESADSPEVLATTYTARENWRLANFGTTANTGNAADGADPDGDAWTNAQEFSAGTDPNDRNSALKITRVQPSGNDLLITFASVSGKTYRLERSDTLAANSWVTVQANIAGTGNPIQITDQNGATVKRRFYRLVVP